jgi:hypothetical protein
MYINTKMTMLIIHMVKMQKVKYLTTYSLLFFLQQNNVENAVYYKQHAQIN